MLIYQNVNKNTLGHSVGSSLNKDLKRATTATTTSSFPSLNLNNSKFLRELGFAVNSNKKTRL